MRASKKGFLIVGGLVGVTLLIAAAGSKEANAAPLLVDPNARSKAGDKKARAKATAASRKAVATKKPISADDTMQIVADAIATGNPKTIRAVADELKKAGYKYADDLYALAREIEARLKRGETRANETVINKAVQETKKKRAKRPAATTAPKPAPAPAPTRKRIVKTKPAPEPALPPPTPAEPTAPQPDPKFLEGRKMAQELAVHLAGTKKYSEDKDMVGAFQAYEGLVVDGKYGPKTAGEIASYGVVPPQPFYWPTDWYQAKKDYKAVLLQYGEQYPEKQTEFQIAAGKVTTA